jgi:hypothetical protein
LAAAVAAAVHLDLLQPAVITVLCSHQEVQHPLLLLLPAALALLLLVV